MKKNLWRNSSQSSSRQDQPSKGIGKLLGNTPDLAFACRLAFEEGPAHHAYSNFIVLSSLLKGLQGIADRLGVQIVPYDGEVVEVLMHRPPHQQHLSADNAYPVDLPVRLILDLAGRDEKIAEEMIEALSEGAPHHVIANIITMHIAEALLSSAVKCDEAKEGGEANLCGAA